MVSLYRSVSRMLLIGGVVGASLMVEGIEVMVKCEPFQVWVCYGMKVLVVLVVIRRKCTDNKV